MKYKILVIVGAADAVGGPLSLDSEIELLSTIGERFGSISAHVVPEATELAITEHLTLDNAQYDSVHFMGHADDQWFYLSESERLSQERIQRICRDAGGRTVFLNSCSSGRIGQYLVNNGLAVALCYSSGVMDKDGILNALRFYAALAKSNDPFEDGLKEGYRAADPGDGSLLWLTNGEYVAQIIKPLKEELSTMAGVLAELGENMTGMGERHDTSFSSFTDSLTSLEKRLYRSLNSLTRSTARMRYALVSVVGALIVGVAALAWLNASGAQTIPPLPTNNGTIPPAASPVPPTKKPKPTNAPASPVPPTKKPKPTDEPTSASTETPTAMPTATESPTSTVAPTNTAQATPRDTETPTVDPTATPTGTATPAVAANPPTATPTATLTIFEKAVRDSVKATVAAWSGCSC